MQRFDTLPRWEEDGSLPQGWKLRHHAGPKGKIFYLAPNGDSFDTRVQALRFLISNEMEGREKMRMGLGVENWHSHPLLPRGWKLRSREGEKNSKTFLTKDATTITGYKQAARYIKDKLTEKEVARFEQLMAEEASSSRKEHYKWEEDQSLPPGWKMRTGKDKLVKEFFLAPDQTQYTSRRVAYQAVIRQGHGEEVVARMRRGLVTCSAHGNDWGESEHLPDCWLYRETSSVGAKGAVHVSVGILSREGALFHSYRAAMDHMQGEAAYTAGDVDRLKELIVARGRERRSSMGAAVKVEPGVKVEVEEGLEEALEVNGEVKEEEGAGVKVEADLPAGWRRVGVTIVSPAGQKFVTKKAALLQLLREGEEEEEVEEMAECLLEEGWQRSSLLPTSWLFQPSPSIFLTTEGEEVEGFTKALEHMMMNNYSDAELDGLQRFMEAREQA